MIDFNRTSKVVQAANSITKKILISSFFLSSNALIAASGANAPQFPTSWSNLGEFKHSMPLLAQASNNEKPEKEKREKSSRSKKRKKNHSKNGNEKKNKDILDYRYELQASFDILNHSGSLQKSGDQAEDFNENIYKLTFSGGMLLGDNFEPILEFSYKSAAKTIGDFENTSAHTSWGLGALFNIPTGDMPKNSYRLNAPLLANSKWIPYGGFIIGSQSHTESGGIAAKTDISENGIRTKLIFGTRYMIFPHLAFNMWLRMSYEQSASEVSESGKTGGTLSKLAIDGKLLSFSIFF